MSAKKYQIVRRDVFTRKHRPVLQGKFQGPGLNRYSKQEDGLFPGKTPQSPAQLFQNILEDKIEVSCLLTQNKDMDLQSQSLKPSAVCWEGV